ncbi:sensor histidine kinase [Microbacterium gorillae]|uniref:sensor histidine kinase n=1 Tax=Microbacterium gorillae TaxID=1231063 RepID=UPI00069408A9|nr:HAMP domain-containing sensor histidine kinase [Microbacterium gorillae]
MTRTWWRWLVVFAPLVLLGVVAAIVGVAGGGGVFELRVPLATVLVGLGLVVTLLLGVLLLALPATRARRGRALVEARDGAEREARASHRRFLARLDHELKNPVTAIRSALAVDGPAPVQNVRIAATQASRLATLVGQLRGLSELETRTIESVPVDLSALVEEEVGAIREELAARGAQRQISTAFPTVPWPLPPVSGDADLLAVVVRNIVLNAVKYSSEGARIEVRGSEDGADVVLDVADTGWGIRTEDLPFVWDELWRSTDARGVEGSGLGLSLVRVVVERHGGEVTLRSQPGRGTSVRLRLPAARR